jgi:phage terminase small subunit
VTALTSRQKKFTEYYAQCGNVVQSAIQAGYSASYANSRAHELLENVGVAAYLRELSAEETESRIISAQERQEILSDLATDTDNEPKDRIKAIDTLNKMTGEYTVKVDASVRSSQKLSDIMAQLGSEGLSDSD